MKIFDSLSKLFKKNDTRPIDKDTCSHNKRTEIIIEGRYNLSDFKSRELTSVELYFLKYIGVRKTYPLKFISGDWTYDYHFNYQDVLNQFVGQNLLKIKNFSLNEKMGVVHTVDDLKGILRMKNIPVSGKKAILIERIIENSTENELKKYKNKRCVSYELTEKGKLLTDPINPSITRDMELEDDCYNLVLNNSIHKAYEKVANFITQKSMVPPFLPFDIDKNGKPLIKSNDYKLNDYRQLTEINLGLPKEIVDKQKNIISCIIVGDMFMCKNFIITKLIQRLIYTGLDDSEIDKFVDIGRTFLRKDNLFT